jgi:hypothetical protein
VGLDSLLARNCSRDPDRDRLACEVSEGDAVIFNSEVWVAFLGGLCRARMASATAREFLLHALDVEEALIEECLPENFARW